MFSQSDEVLELLLKNHIEQENVVTIGCSSTGRSTIVVGSESVSDELYPRTDYLYIGDTIIMYRDMGSNELFPLSYKADKTDDWTNIVDSNAEIRVNDIQIFFRISITGEAAKSLDSEHAKYKSLTKTVSIDRLTGSYSVKILSEYISEFISYRDDTRAGTCSKVSKAKF